MSWLQSLKYYLVNHTHLAKDALHIYVGLLVLLGSAALCRWPLRSGKPLAAAAVVAIGGELWDLRDSLIFHTPLYFPANIKDIANTLFWPIVLTLLARHTRVLERR